MSTSALAQRTQDRLMERIKALRKLKENRKCFECLSKSPSCVDTTHNTFVCMTCGGILRMFNFRVKSISISSFAISEVEALEAGGNRVARKKWLPGFDGEYPTPGNTEQIKAFIRKKYEDNAWVNKSGKSKRKSSNKSDPAEQDQSDDEDSEIPTATAERRKSGSSKSQTKAPAAAAPPDLLDLNSIFSSQPTPVAQNPNLTGSFSSQPQQQQQPYPGQGRPNWGGFDNNNAQFHGSFQQPPPAVQYQQPAQFGQSFPVDPFFASTNVGAPMQYQRGPMPSQPFQPAYGMAPPNNPVSHFQNMMTPNMPQQQQMDPRQQQKPIDISPPQQQQQQPAQPNPDPFADLLAPHAIGTNTGSQSDNRGPDMFANSNTAFGSQQQQQPHRNSIPSDNMFGSFAGQPAKRNSIPSENTFGNPNVAFVTNDAFDGSNPFGPAQTTPASNNMGFYQNQPVHGNYGMEAQLANRASYSTPTQPPFYSQPGGPFSQPQTMPNPQQQYAQPGGPMQQPPAFGAVAPQGYPQQFAPRPVEQFPFNNMPAQASLPSYAVQQMPASNNQIPDFFSKQRAVESPDSDLNSNPFL